MTIAFRSVTSLADSVVDTVTHGSLSGVVATDIVVIWAFQNHSSANSVEDLTLSGGSAADFTRLFHFNTGVASATLQEQFAVWVGRVSGTYTAPTVTSTISTSQGLYCAAMAYSDDDPYTAGNFWENGVHAGPLTTTFGGLSLTTSGTNRVVVQLGGFDDNAAVSAPSAWTNRINASTTTGGDCTLTAEDSTQATAATITTPTRTSTDEWHGYAFALFSAADAGGGGSASGSFNIAGVGTTTYSGKSQARSTTTISGVAASNLIGKSQARSTYDINGLGTSTFTIRSNSRASFDIEGISNTSHFARSDGLGVYSISGIAATNFIGQAATGDGVFAIAGVSAVSFAGESLAEGVFALTGVASSVMEGTSHVEGVMTSVAGASTNFVGSSTGGGGGSTHRPDSDDLKISIGGVNL